MKRFLIVLIALALLLPLASCTESYEAADEYANKFITALLIRDEAEMKKYLHPDHTETAMPDDAFYQTLENQYLTVGHPLTNLSGVGKAKIKDMDGALRCSYIARVNELFYTVELIILDNENGYGIVSVAMVLNTELDYYYHESQVN